MRFSRFYRWVFLSLLAPGICHASATLAVGHAALGKMLRSGDLIFQQSTTSQAAALEEATGSNWTHTGIVMWHDNRWMVAEASATVRYLPLDKFIEKGKKRRFAVKRIKANLAAPGSRALENEIGKYRGKSYDVYFEWSDSSIYCSELVWKVFQPFVILTKPQKFREINLNGPEVGKLILSRYQKIGKKIKLDEPIVTPVAIFNSKKLVPVYDSAQAH